MATVTESSIMSMAKDVVTDFIDGKSTLNEGVIKKATSEGLNTEQTKRLIERTNVDAFLRQYPSTTDFDVADPEVILGVKTAKLAKVAKVTHPDNNIEEDGMFKAASEGKDKPWRIPRLTNGESKEYRNKIASITGDDIFGLNEDEFLEEKSKCKYEYALDRESQAMFKSLNDLHKTAAEISLENTTREMKFNDALEDISLFIKQAALSGRQSIEDSEAELLNKFPENSALVRALYDNIAENMKLANVMPNMLKRAKDPTEISKLASDTELSNKLQNIINIGRNN